MSNIENYKVTKNACKLCTPLGASFVFKGIERCLPLVHGSQGCSTYIRRYMISHFKEPIDIASSNFSEDSAIFGGKSNLEIALDNLIEQYSPEIIGIATTCLSETIGDDVGMLIKEFKKENKDKKLPVLVHVSTASYKGTHADGFNNACTAVVKALAENTMKGDFIGVFPGMVSPADIRYIKEILDDFELGYTVLPDYSNSMDGGLWKEYHKIPEGGTPIDEIKRLGSAAACIQFGRVLDKVENAASFLENSYGVKNFSIGLPVGVTETDKFFEILKNVCEIPIPEKYTEERLRLIDAYADGHKYIFEKKAIVYGEEDLVVGMASFLSEIGIIPVLCASGGRSGFFEEKVKEVVPVHLHEKITIMQDMDFIDIGKFVRDNEVDILIGNSKGYKISREFNIPLIRIGFPIHDRFGGQRIIHIGYRGAMSLFDRIVNSILEKRQADSSVGYTYL